MSIWMLSNRQLFSTGDSYSLSSLADYYYSSSVETLSSADMNDSFRNKISQPATFPLFILFFIILGSWVLSGFTQTVIGCMSWVSQYLTFHLCLSVI